MFMEILYVAHGRYVCRPHNIKEKENDIRKIFLSITQSRNNKEYHNDPFLYPTLYKQNKTEKKIWCLFVLYRVSVVWRNQTPTFLTSLKINNAKG